jgi:hypothetical protein
MNVNKLVYTCLNYLEDGSIIVVDNTTYYSNILNKFLSSQSTWVKFFTGSKQYNQLKPEQSSLNMLTLEDTVQNISIGPTVNRVHNVMPLPHHCQHNVIHKCGLR